MQRHLVRTSKASAEHDLGRTELEHSSPALAGVHDGTMESHYTLH